MQDPTHSPEQLAEAVDDLTRRLRAMEDYFRALARAELPPAAGGPARARRRRIDAGGLRVPDGGAR